MGGPALLRWLARTAVFTVLAAIGTLAAAVPLSPLVTLKSTAEYLQAGDVLPIYVIVNNAGAEPLTKVEITALANDFLEIDPRPREAARSIAPGATQVAEFRVHTVPHLRPGKYTVLFDVRFGRRGSTNRTRLIKDFPIEVRGPLQAGITAPVVNITAKPSSDTLRENSNVQLWILIENKSPLALENVKIEGVESPVLNLVPKENYSAQTIPPFGSWTGMWEITLKEDESDAPKYGKHTLFFTTAYDWKYGTAQFRSEAVTPVEISASFFGSEGFSQVFGIPLNLIIFILPGFFLLFAYRGLMVLLLNNGETFTPTSKDGIFYSVLWSVILIFAYRIVLDKDLYAFFTSRDLLAVNLVGAVAGAFFPVARWVVTKWRLRVQAGLQFSESDEAAEVIRKALARRPDPDKFEEITVEEGEITWSGIAVSGSGEPLVLGPKYQVSIAETLGEELQHLKPDEAAKVPAFLELLRSHLSSGKAKIDVTKPVKKGDKTYPGLKCFAASVNETYIGQSPLIEFNYTEEGGS